MNADEFLGLWANMPRVRAIRALRMMSFGPGMRVDPDDLFSLTLLATGDKNAAEDARVALEQAIADSKTPELNG